MMDYVNICSGSITVKVLPKIQNLLKNLQCGTNKCQNIHIGSTRKESIGIPLYLEGWKEIYVGSEETGAPLIEDVYKGETALGENI